MKAIELKNLPTRIILKLVFIVIISVSFFVYRFLINSEIPICYKDQWHVVSASANKSLDHNNNGNIVIGIGQIIMDCWIVITFFFWLLKLKNTRFGIGSVLFFILRTIHLYIMKFPFPEHIVWHSPGFYSLTVPYDKTRDFYYSGHTGTLTIIMMEYFSLNAKWPFLVVLACLIYTIFMLTITRVHYTIDIIGGLIFALICERIASKYIYYFDYLLSYPYILGKKIKERFARKNDSEPLLAREQIFY